jgi:hypothetical protein
MDGHAGADDAHAVRGGERTMTTPGGGNELAGMDHVERVCRDTAPTDVGHRPDRPIDRVAP